MRADGSFWRPLLVVLVASLVLAPGCGDDDSDDDDVLTEDDTGTQDDTGTDTAGTEPDLEDAAAEISALFESTPSAIAADISDLGLVPEVRVTEGAVQATAATLCESGFDSSVTTNWLESVGALTSTLLLGPSERLLTYSGQAVVCRRPPTEDEVAAYNAGVYAYLAPGGLPSSIPEPDVTTIAERAVCDFLGSQFGGNAVEAVLDEALSLASRGGVNGGGVLTFFVQVAGATCDDWLPLASDALVSYFNG